MLGRDSVKSKWGMGNLYEHPILEVPYEYGETVRCYAEVERRNLHKYFNEYFVEEFGIN